MEAGAVLVGDRDDLLADLHVGGVELLGEGVDEGLGLASRDAEAAQQAGDRITLLDLEPDLLCVRRNGRLRLEGTDRRRQVACRRRIGFERGGLGSLVGRRAAGVRCAVIGRSDVRRRPVARFGAVRAGRKQSVERCRRALGDEGAALEVGLDIEVVLQLDADRDERLAAAVGGFEGDADLLVDLQTARIVERTQRLADALGIAARRAGAGQQRTQGVALVRGLDLDPALTVEVRGLSCGRDGSRRRRGLADQRGQHGEVVCARQALAVETVAVRLARNDDDAVLAGIEHDQAEHVEAGAGRPRRLHDIECLADLQAARIELSGERARGVGRLGQGGAASDQKVGQGVAARDGPVLELAAACHDPVERLAEPFVAAAVGCRLFCRTIAPVRRVVAGNGARGHDIAAVAELKAHRQQGRVGVG